MTTTTPDPIQNDVQRVMVRQTVTGFEQGIAALGGLLTAGPLGAVAAWGSIRGLQGKWTPWAVLGCVGAPLCIGVQVGAFSALMDAGSSSDSGSYETSRYEAPAPEARPEPTYQPAPAPEAQPAATANKAATCDFPTDDTVSGRDTYRCSVTERTNANGHTVHDISLDGRKISVVLWDNGSAEYFEDGTRFEGSHFTMGNGQTSVTLEGAEDDRNKPYRFTF